MRILSLSAMVLSLGSAIFATPVTYNVTVNTSSIAGTVGSLDFNFNPGPLLSQSASVQILSFTSDGTLATLPTLNGDVSGALPGPLTIDNGTPYNDYFGIFTFGSMLSFDVDLYGPALSSPDGVSNSGSTFAFSMFSNAAGTMPALTTDNVSGFAYVVAINLDGSTTVSDFTVASPAPEPSSFAMMAVILGLGFLMLRRSVLS